MSKPTPEEFLARVKKRLADAEEGHWSGRPPTYVGVLLRMVELLRGHVDAYWYDDTVVYQQFRDELAALVPEEKP